MPRCGARPVGLGASSLPSRAERQASLRRRFLAGRFAGRFPASDSSGVPRVLGLAAVPGGGLGLPAVQETRPYLQPPAVQRQAEDHLPERQVPERPVPAAAAELCRDGGVSLLRVPPCGSGFCAALGFACFFLDFQPVFSASEWFDALQ